VLVGNSEGYLPTDPAGKVELSSSQAGQLKLQAIGGSEDASSNVARVCVAATPSKCPAHRGETIYAAAGPMRSRPARQRRDPRLGRRRSDRRPLRRRRRGRLRIRRGHRDPGQAPVRARPQGLREGEATLQLTGKPGLTATALAAAAICAAAAFAGGCGIGPRARLPRRSDADRDPRLRLAAADRGQRVRPQGIRDRDPLPRPRDRSRDPLWRRLRAVDRRSLRQLRGWSQLRLVLLRERDRVAGRIGRGRRSRRRSDLVGLPRLDRCDAGSRRRRLLAGAVPPALGLRRRAAPRPGRVRG